MAKELGVSLGGVNYALQALSKRRFVNAKNFKNSDTKPAQVYLLTTQDAEKKPFLRLLYQAEN